MQERVMRPPQNMLLATCALGLGATLTTLHIQFEREAETALGLPPGFHSYALLPIGYPLGRCGPVRRIALADVVYEDQWASVPRLGSGNAPHSWISRFLYPWRSAANYPPERNPFNLKRRTGLCLAALSWLGPFPAIPQWKCPIVPRPSKIMLSNATSPTGIEKGSSPVRGLWSEPRPLVVTSKLSLPIIWCDRRSPIFHLASPEPSVRAPFGFVFSENDP
jgi:hypothetical protein